MEAIACDKRDCQVGCKLKFAELLQLDAVVGAAIPKTTRAKVIRQFIVEGLERTKPKTKK